MAAVNSIRGFGHWNLGTTGGGAASLAMIHSDSLVTNDTRGGLEPRLAVRLPSFDDGSMVSLPDGRLQTTWRLWPNVKWQDGAPFSVEDVVFGQTVNAHPEIPGQGGVFQLIERIGTHMPSTPGDSRTCGLILH